MKIIFNPLSGKFDFINDGVITGSGTSGQVAFWDSSTNITGESNLYWDSTNDRIGVNTTTPRAPLHVGPLTGGNGTAQERLRISGDWTTTGSGSLIRFTNQIDSGTTPNAGEYNIAGIAGIDDNANWGGSLYFQTANTGTSGGSALTTKMVISADGNVGIGTTTPAQKLHVAGIGRFDASLFVGATLSTGDAAIKLGQGRTGIGYAFVDLVGDTTYTDYALRFIRNNTGANASSEILHRGTGDLNIATVDVANIRFTTNSGERLKITSSGNVGINQSNPGHTLDVNGSINASTFYNNVNTAFNVLRNNLGNPTVEEKALFHGQFNNKFRFIPPTLQEESTDGVTWTTSTRATSDQLGDMMRGEGQGTSFIAIPTGTMNTYGGYRLTWDVVGTTGYVFLDQVYIYNSTNGNNVTLKIEAYHNTNGWTTLSTQTSNNWPGHWSVKHTSIPYSNSASQYSRMRLTFESNRTLYTNSFSLYAIEWFGGYPAGQRNVESYDRSKNVYFPGTVQGSRLISTIATGTAPLSVISTTVSTNLNADMVDGYHSSSLWRSDGGVWNPTANILLNQTANNQEWSFDITRNGFTGGYWHVWDSTNNTMLKVDAVTGKVSAPYNFVGNLEGSAATLTTSRTISLTGDVSYTSDPFNGSANVTGTATLASVGTAGTYTKVTTDAKGRVTSGTTLSATDIPALDAAKITTGTIDAARLPSYVDDVIEGANLAAFPVTGETGKIYVALDTNKTYRWSGSAYVYITSGAVDSVAGKTGVVTLVKADVGLSNVDNTADSTKSVSSAATLTTARTLTIGSTGKTFNGSADVSWTLAEIGAYAATNPSGYITSSGNTSGYSGTLLAVDDRTISPSDLTAGRLRFGFTSWANNNTSPYADFLHLRSYTDASGGLDNLVMFRKDVIGMRIWQQSWGSATAYSSFKDVAFTDSNITGNAATATTLATARSINGTSFNGSADITTANWGTSRTITIGSTGKSVNGSADVSWTLAEIGAQATLTNPVTGTGTTNYLPKFTAASTIGDSQIFDNGTNVGIGTTSPGAKLDITTSNWGVEAEAIRFGNLGAPSHYNAIKTFTSVTGANNYLSFYVNDGGSGSSEVIRLRGNGNVGIGTTAPGYKLEVSGTAYATLFSSLNGYNVGQSSISQAGNSNLVIANAGWGFVGRDIDINPDRNLNITATDTTVSGNIKVTGGYYDSSNSVGTSGQVLSSTGTGTAWIAAPGAGSVTGTGSANRIPYWSSTSNLTFNSNLYWDNTNSRLGIGTTSPSAKVHLVEGNFVTRFLVGQSTFTGYNSGLTTGQKGNIIVGQANSTNNAYVINFAYQGSSSTSNFIGLGFYNNDDIVVITAGKNVGIATTSPNTAYTTTIASILGGTGVLLAQGSVKIDGGALGVGMNASSTIGRIDASNDIVPFSSSDLRLKENIKNIESPIEKVKKLNGIEFDWIKELEEHHGYSGHDTGVIAQEVQDVLPTAVRTNASGYLAVRYEKLIGLLIEAVKEQQAEIDYLKSKL